MGTKSTLKVIKNVAGALTEVAALTTSAGAADRDNLVALNADGVLDASIMNGKTTSVGVADAGSVPLLGANGRLSDTFLPVGIGADTRSIMSSEILAGGDLVNIWSDAGTAKVRKADATIAGKEAVGFVLAGVGSGVNAEVYFEGSNTAMSGLTPGSQFLSTTAGITSTTAPFGAGNVAQRVGFATDATTMNFQSGIPITLA